MYLLAAVRLAGQCQPQNVWRPPANCNNMYSHASLSTTPRIRMEEWSYSSTILDLGFKPLPLYPRYPLDRRRLRDSQFTSPHYRCIFHSYINLTHPRDTQLSASLHSSLLNNMIASPYTSRHNYAIFRKRRGEPYFLHLQLAAWFR
jgi:hypothetical protein